MIEMIQLFALDHFLWLNMCMCVCVCLCAFWLLTLSNSVCVCFQVQFHYFVSVHFDKMTEWQWLRFNIGKSTNLILSIHIFLFSLLWLHINFGIRISEGDRCDWYFLNCWKWPNHCRYIFHFLSLAKSM